MEILFGIYRIILEGVCSFDDIFSIAFWHNCELFSSMGLRNWSVDLLCTFYLSKTPKERSLEASLGNPSINVCH